ncbi:MAG: tetratricopeptide repeat protein [Bacteroidales bacterium]|nr:tetratricopeptide repeat protein [Bacteroidales bacterium]
MRKKISKLLFSTLILLTLWGCVSKQPLPPKVKEYTSAELKIDGIFLDASTQKQLGNNERALELYDEVLRQNPNYAAAYFDKASVMYNQKDSQKAIELTQKAIQLQPNNIWYRLQLGEIFLNMSDYENASKVIEELILINPNEIEYYQQLIQIYSQQPNEEKMLKTFDRMEKKWGISEEAIMIKFRFFMDKKNYDKAEQEINKLQNISPTQKSYLAILAEINMNKKNYSKALEYYKKIEVIDPYDPYINISLANFYLIQEKRSEVYSNLQKAFANKALDYQTKMQVLITIYGKTVDADETEYQRFFSLLKILSLQYPDESVVWELLSTCYIKENQYEETVKAIRRAIAIGESTKSKQSHPYDLYQNLLYAQSTLNQPDTLIQDAKRALELFPEQPLPYLFLGVNYLLKEEYKESQKALERGLSLVIEDKLLKEDFYSNLGEVHYRIKEKDKAYNYFDKALEINPKNYLILNNYAYYLSLDGSDLDKADKMAKTVYEKYKNIPTYVDTYAWVLYIKKDYQKAYIVMQSIIKDQEQWSQTIKEHYELILKALNP